MRNLLNSLILLVLAGTCLRAQSEADTQTSDVSFFNATIAEARLYVDWSGRDAFPDGLASGQSMGPLMIRAEEASIEAKAEGFLPAKTAVKLVGGERTTLLFFEGAPEKEQQGEKPKPRLRVYQTPGIPAAPPKEYAWPAIYVGPAPTVQINVNGEPIQLSRGKTVVVARGKNVVQLTQGSRELAAVAVEEPSRRLFVIYGPAEELRGGVVYQ